ncbi:MAG: hypothetical protein ACPH50_06410 [Candidatus Puniceispirillaceae bacterium]|jgi:hypothetical protein
MGAVHWVNGFGLFNAMFMLAMFLWSQMMSAIALYKHTCHFCEAVERAVLRTFTMIEGFLARIQTANKAAAMAARGENEQAKALMLQG